MLNPTSEISAGSAMGQVPRLGALTTIAGLLVVATLYVGRDILVPFALAVLLGFVLDPLVVRLRRWGLPRAPAVALVIMFTVATLGATSFFVGTQVVQLSKNLPTYQSTILQIAGLRFVAGTPLRRADGMVIAALCVMDTRPRQFSERESRLLETQASDLLMAASQPADSADRPPVSPAPSLTPPLHAA